MNIDWKARIKNKSFWVALVPAVLLLFQLIAVPFGYDFKIEGINEQLLAIINAAFALLSILGVVSDPKSKGISDVKNKED